jgi:signal transduction histidine kinase
MSLRLRLTILYSALTGGILLVFGMLIFLLVSILLVNQVDNILTSAAREVLSRVRFNSYGRLSLSEFSRSDLMAGVSVLLLDEQGKVEYASTFILDPQTSLDTNSLKKRRQEFSSAYVAGFHLRVLNIPLKMGARPVGTLQLAYNISTVDDTQRVLLQVIIITTLTSILVAAAASWLSLDRALSPLAAVTETAMQITRADDLSRRIPLEGLANDEVGRLVAAFNETLERLEHLFNSQQRFLADVSHELRTPLTVIKGNVALMRKIGGADDDLLAGIEDESDRLTRLVVNLLLEAQAESGKLPLHFAALELDTLLLEVFKEMRVLARERVHLKIIEIDQVMVNGDRDRLEQVLINLISNAIKYTPAGGDVFVSLARVGENARIIVRDTGVGISKKDLPHIFERFYRAEKSRSRAVDSGFGLGLSISHWIITHHGGRIEVNSVEGKGTTFLIYLPLLKTEAEAPAGKAA